MKVRLMVCLSASLFFCSLFFCLGVAQARSSDAPVVILHVTVIDPGTSSVEPDRAVTISGNHISAVSDAKNFHPRVTLGSSTDQVNF
jgi:hypothetical protein